MTTYLFLLLTLCCFTCKTRLVLPRFLIRIRNAMEKTPPLNFMPTGSPAAVWNVRYWKYCYSKLPDKPPTILGLDERPKDRPELGGEWLLLYLANKVASRSGLKRECIYTINSFEGMALIGPTDNTNLYGAVSNKLATFTAHAGPTYRSVFLTVNSTFSSPLTVNIPHGIIFEPLSKDQMPLFTLKDATFHLLPGRSYTMELETFSLSLFGSIPNSTLRLTPFLFWGELPVDTVTMQGVVWQHTDEGRQYQILDYLKQNKGKGHPTCLIVVSLCGFLAVLGMYLASIETNEKLILPPSEHFSAAAIIAMSAYFLTHDPDTLPIYLLFGLANVALDYWLAVIFVFLSLGFVLCTMPLHRFIVHPSSLIYSPLLIGFGLNVFIHYHNRLSFSCLGASFFMILFHIPHILCLLTTVPLFIWRGFKGVTTLFQRLLPLFRLIVYPAFGAFMIVVGSSILLNGPGVKLLHGFGFNPMDAQLVQVLLEMIFPILGLSFLCITGQILIWLSFLCQMSPVEDSNDKKKKKKK